jgi:hypothetical protein
MRRFLFAGTLLIFLAFYKGDGGYHDLVNYLEDAEGLWLHADMRRLASVDEEELPDGKVVEHRTYDYSQYSLGLAFVSGPFVLFAKGVDLMTGEKTVDDDGKVQLSPRARKIAVLIIPVFAALTCLLLFEIGLMLGISARASLWTATMFAAGSSLLTFARLYYTEVAVVFFTILSVWAILRCHDAAGKRPALWALLAGLGAAGAAGCHYAEAVMIAPLGLGMSLSVLLRRSCSFYSRARQLAALAFFPVLAGVAILAMNKYRHGSIGDTGYGSDVAELTLTNIASNVRMLLTEHLGAIFGGPGKPQKWILEKPGLFVRNLWVLPAMVCLIPFRDSSAQRVKTLRIALLGGIVLQVLFWMSYSMLAFSPVRYFLPATGALAIGLLFVGAWIEKQWPRWGLSIVGLVLIAWNLMFFFMNDDHNAPFVGSDKLLIYTWYMDPFPGGLMDGYGTPVGPTQWCTLAILLSVGIVCLAIAYRKVNQLPATETFGTLT